ncbi:MAG: rhodanese-like domain-containing protein [Burkholderiales bacterium]
MFLQFLIDNIFMVAIFVISGGMLLWPILSGGFGTGREIGTIDATHLINRENALVLDVREDHEYALMHIPNSRHIPLSGLDGRLNELTKFKDRPVIVSCQSGNRSGKAVQILEKNQFSKIYVLRGGIGAWEEASLPLERSKA